MKTLGFNPTEEDLQQMIFTVDYDGEQSMSLAALLNGGHYMAPRVLKNISRVDKADEWNIFQHERRMFFYLQAAMLCSIYYINTKHFTFAAKGAICWGRLSVVERR